MVDAKKEKLRLDWIDWMKTLAMYMIVAGHNNVPGSSYIYVFSVPCFFIICGFLTKHETDVKMFWMKLWWNLLVPMFFFVAIHVCYVSITQLLHGTFQITTLFTGVLMAMLGMQGQDSSGIGLGAMWFVYTLAICKILFQYTASKKTILILESILCVSIAIVLHQLNIVVYNSWVNVLLAMPFFVMGNLIRPYQMHFNVSVPLLFLFIVVSFIGVWFCGNYNEAVYIYRCSYGDNIVLCLLGAISGTMLIYSLSMLLRTYLKEFVKVVGGGTLIILGLHGDLFLRTINFVTHNQIQGYWKYLEALFVILAIVPIIHFIKCYIPMLYGIKRLH